jgi:hypothetical protein
MGYQSFRPVALAMMAAAISTASGGSASRAAEPWYRSRIVGIEVGPTGANIDPLYMSRMTGKRIIENFLRARAEYVVVFLKDMEFAYYDSKVDRKCPGLGGRDLLREVLDAAAPHRIPVVAYQQVQYDDLTWRAHPEWRMRDPEGKEIGGRLCYNSGCLEHSKAVAAELMEYPIAGFHFDMLDQGFGPPVGCWCDRCRDLFRKEHGADPPKGITWDEGWDRMLRFRATSSARFCRELQAFVRSRRPDISVDFNYHGYPPFSWHPGQFPALHAGNGDFVTAEGLPWVFGHNNPSLMALFMAGARPGGPVQGVTSRSVWDYHDFTVRPAAELVWEVLTYMALGAQCTIVDKANYDGSLDPVAYDRIGVAFEAALERRHLFGHRQLPRVGLWYSSRARDWYGRENPARYNAAFWGAHRALVQAHIPMAVVADETATPERLRELPIVYLPGAAIVEEREARLLDEFVSAGGRLLATGPTGMYDRMGNPGERCSLAETLGVKTAKLRAERPDQYLRLPGSLAGGAGAFLLEGIPPDWPILTWGPAVAVEPGGAKAFGDALASVRTPPNNWGGRMSPGEAIGPAVLLHERGKGIAAWITASVDAAFAGEYRVPEHRNLLANVLRRLDGDPPVVIDAPRNVECAVTRDDARKRTIVHLVAYWAPPTFAAGNFTEGRRVLATQMEEAGGYRASIAVRRPFSKVSAYGPASKVFREPDRVRIETSEIHDALIIED